MPTKITGKGFAMFMNNSDKTIMFDILMKGYFLNKISIVSGNF